MGLWFILLKLTKYTSLSNLLVGLLYSPLYWFFAGTKWFDNRSWWGGGIGLISFIFAAWRHKENIKRLIKGTERKIGQKVEIKEEETTTNID